MLGIVFALSANLVFSLSNVIFKKTERDTSPTMINLFRTTVGLITYVIIALIANRFTLIFQFPPQLIGFLLLSSLFGQVMGDTAYFFSQRYMGPAKALAVSLTYPFFTILIDVFFLHGSFNPWILLAAAIICGGVLLIAYSQSNKQNEPLHINIGKKEVILGLTFALIASLSWAIGITFTDLSMTQIDETFSTGRLTSVVGTLVRFPLAVFLLTSINFSILFVQKRKEPIHTENRSIDLVKYQIRGRTKSSWGWLVAGALIGTSIGLYLYTEAAYIAGAVTMALMTTAGPIFSILLDWMINKEKISPLGLLGIVLTLGGVVVIILI